MSLTRGPVLLVTGGRDYKNWEHVDRVLREIDPRCIVHGGATGADSMADTWAKANGVPCFKCDANWDVYGMDAGGLRNGWMIEFVKVELVVAFPGKSGTENMVRQAKKAGGIDIRDER